VNAGNPLALDEQSVVFVGEVPRQMACREITPDKSAYAMFTRTMRSELGECLIKFG